MNIQNSRRRTVLLTDDDEWRFFGGDIAMRLIVPLQGLLQGRGGLVMGSVIPCALVYLLQLFLKRNRTSPLPPTRPASPPASDAPELCRIPRSYSRGLLSPRGSMRTARISSRASLVSDNGESPYYAGLAKVAEDPYNPFRNPDGIIQLGLAENKLVLDLLQDWLVKYLKDGRAEAELSICRIATYHPFDGTTEFKIAVAAFMGKVMRTSTPFDPSQLVLLAGATPALEILSFCLADPGNAFLVPSPYYPGFDRDIKWRAGVELVPVPCRSVDNFYLSLAALDRAYNQTRNRGVKVCAVLISNPCNPVGSIMSREMLSAILDFAMEKNIHVISNEVFAGSVYGKSNFVSMAEIMHSDELGQNRVHIVYGLSKALSVAGFRVGAIYSHNERVLAASRRLARFAAISSPAQSLLASLLMDTKFIDNFIKESQYRLGEMHDLFVRGLKELGINCADSSGGFFCWADMSKFIQPYSQKGELDLWDKLLDVAKINITPGSCCHCIEPGWFRICFASLSEEDVSVVMDRIHRVCRCS